MSAVAGAVSAVAMISPAEAGPAYTSPVGTWSGTVTRPGATDNIQLGFTKTGQACLFTKDGESTGTWTATSPVTFNYKILEALIANGKQTGWVHVNQDAVQHANAFDSAGISQIYDLNGKLIGAAPSTVSVTRVSVQPPSNC